MNKTELVKTLENVIASITNEMNATESAFNYVKLDVRKKTFEEVKEFIVNELDEPKTAKKGE